MIINNLRSLVLLTAIAFNCLNSLNSQVIGGEIIPFSVRENITIKGDMTVTGNSILGIRGSFDNGEYAPNDEYHGLRSNGGGGGFPIRAYIDIDSDPNFSTRFSATFLENPENINYGGTVNANGSPTSGSSIGTFSSSGAELLIDPTHAIVKRAYLYWSGIYPSETLERSSSIPIIPRTSFGANAGSDYTEIKILPPMGSQYYNISINPPTAPANPNNLELKTEVIVDGLDDSVFNIQSELDAEEREIAKEEARLRRSLTANEIEVIRNNINVPTVEGAPYVCIADITALFNKLQNEGQSVAGFWTVGNVKASTGSTARGIGAGWTLAVIYEENLSTTSVKEISFLDGFTYVNNLDVNPTIIEIPHFTPVSQGSVRAWFATASLEGDRSFSGDQFSVETLTFRELSDSVFPLSENSSPPNNNNFFNSTITSLSGNTNFRSPNSSNLLGYDTDHFELINTNNIILNNSEDNSPSGITDRSLKIWLSTQSDGFVNFFNAFAIETDQCIENNNQSNPILISNISRPTLNCITIEPPVNEILTGEYIEFDISGGTPPYNYVVREIIQGFSGSSVNRMISGTTNRPRIEFPSSDDGKNFQIEITDSSGACIENFVDFTPSYPIPPIIDDSTADINVCNGDAVILSINPVLTSGQNLNDFEYSFDGGNAFQSGNTLNVNLGANLSENFDLVLRDKQTQCTDSKTVSISQSSPFSISSTAISLGANDATIYFNVSTTENLEFIEVSISNSNFPFSEPFVFPSANNTDRYSRYGDSDFPEFSTNDSPNLFAITGVEFGTSVIISIRSSVSNCLNSSVVQIPFNSVLSIDDIKVEAVNQNSFYPNPAKDQVYFMEEVERIDVFNIQGALLKTFSNVEHLDLQFLQKGVYFIHIYNSDKIQSLEKLVKE